MQLKAYLAAHGLTHKEFGKLIGVEQSTVTRYLDDRVPEAKVMARIVEVTNGAVTPNDFFGIGEGAAA